jgi:hypothetical protein
MQSPRITERKDPSEFLVRGFGFVVLFVDEAAALQQRGQGHVDGLERGPVARSEHLHGKVQLAQTQARLVISVRLHIKFDNK